MSAQTWIRRLVDSVPSQRRPGDRQQAECPHCGTEMTSETRDREVVFGIYSTNNLVRCGECGEQLNSWSATFHDP